MGNRTDHPKIPACAEWFCLCGCMYSLSLISWPWATGAVPPTLGTQRPGPKKLPFSLPDAHTDNYKTTVHCESEMLMGIQTKTTIDYTLGGRGSQ